ncbi:MAG TPA: VOC family protein [Chitinispirillaceae bacterium]|nr:VOC family protein [Chitinispirillaceae bacterium]
MSKLKLSSFVLFVNDVSISKNFYETNVDQEVTLSINDINVGFKSGLALWQKQYAEKIIFEKEMESNKDQSSFEIYFETSQIEELFEKMQKNNVKILHPVKIQPWQQRVFRIYDPDDYIIEIGETMDMVVKRLKNDGLSVESICTKTFMPKEIVEAMLLQSNS